MKIQNQPDEINIGSNKKYDHNFRRLFDNVYETKWSRETKWSHGTHRIVRD